MIRDPIPHAPISIEPERRERYALLSDHLEASGFDTSLLFANPSYFARNGEDLVELSGSHPTVVHWPLEAYAGGERLSARLLHETRTIQATAGIASLAWVDPRHWHSTIFSPIHSSDPRVIASVDTDIADVVSREARVTSPYVLSFTRIMIFPDGSIKAVGYADSKQLNALRRRLELAVPQGGAPNLIHISLGTFLDTLPPSHLASLKQYVRQFNADEHLLGQMAIDELAYAQYQGPFTRMTIRAISRHRLKTGVSDLE